VIELAPTLDSLAADDADDVNPCLGESLTRWRNAHELALVSALHFQASHDFIPFGNHILHRNLKVRKSSTQHGDKLLGAFDTGSLSRSSIVIHKVRSGKLLDYRQISGVKAIIYAADKSLVLFRHTILLLVAK